MSVFSVLRFKEYIFFSPLCYYWSVFVMSGGDTFEVHSVAGRGRDVTFGVGRGQHLASLCSGRGRSVSPSVFNYTVDQSVVGPPLAPSASSTPLCQSAPELTQVISVEALGDMFTNLAKQIGEHISANLSTMHQPSMVQPQSPSNQSSSNASLSQLKVVVHSDNKPPPYFRGDHSDTFSVHEWEDMMKCYLNRVKCDTHSEMYDLIMSRLTGRARDVVKVSLRSRPELSTTDLPMAVFDILRGNFSELSYSNLPMKDFYSTIPHANESAMDYWIRLNKSIDAADECLRRRGRSVEDPSAEVVMMFINHCPDPSLAMSFQLKAPERWTAAEVQERLDSHMRRVRKTAVPSRHAAGLAAYSQSPVTVSFQPFSPAVSQATSVACQSEPPTTSLPPPVLTCNQSRSDEMVVSPHKPAVLSPQPAAIPSSVAAVPPTAEPGVQQVVAMFDKVLSLCNTSLAASQRTVHRQPAHRYSSRSRNQQRSESFTCRVCGSADHSTHAHCRLYRLCLNCFSPGHIRLECPQTTHSSAALPPSHANADLN